MATNFKQYPKMNDKQADGVIELLTGMMTACGVVQKQTRQQMEFGDILASITKTIKDPELDKLHGEAMETLQNKAESLTLSKQVLETLIGNIKLRTEQDARPTPEACSCPECVSARKLDKAATSMKNRKPSRFGKVESLSLTVVPEVQEALVEDFVDGVELFGSFNTDGSPPAWRLDKVRHQKFGTFIREDSFKPIIGMTGPMDVNKVYVKVS